MFAIQAYAQCPENASYFVLSDLSTNDVHVVTFAAPNTEVINSCLTQTSGGGEGAVIDYDRDIAYMPDGPDTYTVTGLTGNGIADIDVTATFVGDNPCTYTLSAA